MNKTQVYPMAVIPAAVQTSKGPETKTAPSLAIHGKYSIERLLELDEYSRTKSYWHVFWVLIRVPLVPLIVIILFQLPRLAPPQDGLQANWVYVVERSAVGTAIACECSLVLSRALMPELIPVLTRRMGILFDLFGGAVYAALIVTFSLVWGFPVPFTPSLVNSIALLSNNVIFNVVVRPIVSQSSDLQRRVKLGSVFFGVFSVAGIAYPAYIALFFAVGERSSHYQPLITPVAPLMTLVLRKLIAHATNEWEDLIPVQVVFSIEFFSSLYQTISLQTSSSALTTAAIIALDFAETARSQWKLYKQTKALQLLLQATGNEALLRVVATACDDPASLQAASVEDAQRLRSIQLYSTAHSRHVSIARQQRLKKIHQAEVFSSSDRSFEGKLSNEEVASSPVNRLRSAVTKVMLARKATAPRTTQIQAKMSVAAASVIAQGIQSTVVVEATTLLFRTEMLLLAEYRECIIPLFYAINMVFVWLSQNATYYTNTEAIKTTDDLLRVLLSILVLFALELASFVVLSVVLWRRLRLSPLHQLAFVLESQATLIRANMLFTLVLTLTFNLVHAGVDFSFQFKWLDSRDVAGISN